MNFSIHAVIITITLLLLVSMSGFLILQDALAGETNFDILADYLFPCDQLLFEDGEKNVIIRIDDVQAYAWSDISIRMINDALVRSVPPTLGVIPKGIKGDVELYRFLRNNRCNIEIAQHGWDHDTGEDGVTPEFAVMRADEAYEDIMRGKEALETLYREPILTFIPPNNAYSEGTGHAIARAEIPMISSEGTSDFDYHTATFDYNEDRLVSVNQVIDECEHRFEKHSLCVIMLHPQDFADDLEFNEDKYTIYIDLLDGLIQRDISFVRFKDVWEETVSK